MSHCFVRGFLTSRLLIHLITNTFTAAVFPQVVLLSFFKTSSPPLASGEYEARKRLDRLKPKTAGDDAKRVLEAFLNHLGPDGRENLVEEILGFGTDVSSSQVRRSSGSMRPLHESSTPPERQERLTRSRETKIPLACCQTTAARTLQRCCSVTSIGLAVCEGSS
ncbi:uncharacterized protein BJX67DRAFT_365743 [Aspergillus lucknowensis]|uniref:Uncharacterized protein n=1 Tax=Aspergillus lucknowensis TaxID=176173 RepID=A0ABR4LE09_9EURO